MSYRVWCALCRPSWRRCLPAAPLVRVTHARCTAGMATLHHTCRVLCPSQPQVQCTQTSTSTSAASTTKTSNSSPSQASSSCGVDERLVTQLQRLLLRGETSATPSWRPISALYRALSPETRRDLVRPHKTLLHVLQKVQPRLDIELDKLGTHYRRVRDANEALDGDILALDTQASAAHAQGGGSSDSHADAARKTDRTATTASSSSSSSSSSAAQPRAGLASVLRSTTQPGGDTMASIFCNFVPIPTAVSTQGAGSTSSSTNDLLAELKSKIPPVDFYYNVDLRCLPPPPEDFDITPSALPRPRASEDGSVIALRDFVHYIPPFFVPVREVLGQMPGYTEAHLIKYFTSRVTELVTVGAERYIRLYGGNGEVPLEGCEDAEAMYAQYKPDCSLLPAFVKSFAGVCDTWMPLELLLERTEAAAVARLPLQGPAAITYFAQMQHVFAFAAEPCTGLKAAVLLRSPGFTGLDTTTSPTPKSCNYVLRAVPADGTLDLHVLQQSTTMPEAVRAEIASYFGSLDHFLRAHGSLFHVAAEQGLVMRARYHARMQRANLSLEERLQFAVKERDKPRIRGLRRQIVARDHPDHPLLDPDNLAREVSRYLPEHGHVSQKSFLTALPEEMLYFMPRNYRRFFANYPQYYQVFEYQKASRWHIAKAGEPLPRGAVRQTFTEHDIIRLVAEIVQQTNDGKATCWTILLHLPHGAQQFVRRRHGKLYYLIEKYPQYFSLVLATESTDAMSQAMVHLIRVPTESSLTSAANGGGSGGMGGAMDAAASSHASGHDVVGEEDGRGGGDEEDDEAAEDEDNM